MSADPRLRRLLADSAGLVAILLFVMVAGWQAASYGLWERLEPAPGLFPFLVCVLAGLCALVALAGLVVDHLAGIDPPAGEDEEAEGPFLWRKVAIYVVALVAWPIAFAWIGWLLSTALGLMLIMRFAENMSWRESLIVTAGALLGSWLLFVRLLDVPLPRGVLPWI